MIRTLLRSRRVAKCWLGALLLLRGEWKLSARFHIRLPECEITAANEPDGYWQRPWKMLREKENQAILHDRNDHMEAKHYHRRTCAATSYLPGPETEHEPT